MSFVRIVSLTALVGVIIYVAVSLKTNPELSSSDNIVKLVSSNPIIAVLQFVLLYMLKGISMVFPSAVLNIATGMVFDFPCNAAYGYLVVSTSKRIKKIFLTHGHLHKIETKEQISKLGLNEGDIVLSGHTHVSGIFFKESGVININPGSISIPKGGTQKGFALLSENAIELYDLDGNLLNSYKF